MSFKNFFSSTYHFQLTQSNPSSNAFSLASFHAGGFSSIKSCNALIHLSAVICKSISAETSTVTSACSYFSIRSSSKFVKVSSGFSVCNSGRSVPSIRFMITLGSTSRNTTNPDCILLKFSFRIGNPPPVLTKPRTCAQTLASDSASASRNAASPSSSNIWGMGLPAVSSMMASVSRKLYVPMRRARASPTADFPEPIIPMR
mmetsp:Transcript_7974/g.14355  ORF Transcript_7974/g.14355 Transcript_7974/m.14355 type:complete len:202 (-) Transcript_7974:401-1006(-)